MEKGTPRKTILVLSRGSTFMVDTILHNLTTEGYQAIYGEPSVDVLQTYSEHISMIVFYMGRFMDMEEGLQPAFEYINKLVEQKGIPFATVGNDAEYEILDRYIPRRNERIRLQKPMVVYDLIQQIDDIIHNTGSKKRILLVDDDNVFLKMAYDWLKGNYTVTMAGSGEECLAYLDGHLTDLILLDYSMPGMSGADTLERIRARETTKYIPVVFLTGKNDQESVLRVLSLNPQGYILKTSGKDELLSRVAEVLSRHSPVR